MKRKITLLCICLAMLIAAGAQEKSSIKILILSPTKTSADPSLVKESDSVVRAISKVMLLGSEDSSNWKKLTPNQRRGAEALVRYLQKPDIFKLASVSTADLLQTYLYHHFNEMLLLMKDTATDNKSALKQLATTNGVNYVISFPEVALYKQSGETNIKLRYQLYDASTDSVVFVNEFAGNTFEQVSEDYCAEKTVGCLLQNGVSFMSVELMNALADVNPVLGAIRESATQQNALNMLRSQILVYEYLPKPWDGSLAKSVIGKDSSINTDDMFYSFQNAEKTKFLSLFARHLTEKENIQKPDSTPAIKVYYVAGMLYNGKWYYDMQERYFPGEDIGEVRVSFFQGLQDWDFFTENDTTFNVNFWEGGPFRKVPDLTKHPKWEENKENWKFEELENRDYIGMYEIVARSLRADKIAVRTRLANNTLEKFIKGRINKNVQPVFKYNDKYYELRLFTPKDLSAGIGALEITNSKGIRKLQFYVVLPASNEIYEWTKFNRVLKKDESSMDVMYELLSSLTASSVYNDFIDDKSFWDNHVLLKQNGKYKYLKPLK